MRYFLVLIVALSLSSASSTSDAQVRVRVNLNIATQPVWGPTGYDRVENYYFPDIDIYYNVPQHRYYYSDGGRWIYSSSLPARFHDFDLYHSYKVVVNDREPWRNNEMYRERYASYKGRHDQQVIRDSRDPKYFANKDHPQHKDWLQQQQHDKGKHSGGDKRNNGNAGKKDNRQKSVRTRH